MYQFSFESYKTKPKVATLVNHKGTRQSIEPTELQEIACS